MIYFSNRFRNGNIDQCEIHATLKRTTFKQILGCSMQKISKNGLRVGMHLAPIRLCNDIADMRNVSAVYLLDLRNSVIADLIVHCCYEKFSPRPLTNFLPDVFANDLLNQSMNRHTITCRIVVVNIDIGVMSSCYSDKRKSNQYANCFTNSVNTCIQAQCRRLAFE